MKAKTKSDKKVIVYTKPQVEIMNQFRLLWEQHGAWTWSAITSLVFGLPNTDAVIGRLLRNPVDFEQALRPYYGKELAAQFKDLLTEHLVIAADLVNAAKAGATAAAAEIEQAWYANADAIAVFLARINPYWSESRWQQMMYTHLAMVKAMAVHMLGGQYQAAISAYDQNELHMLAMADAMSLGIIRQFKVQ